MEEQIMRLLEQNIYLQMTIIRNQQDIEKNTKKIREILRKKNPQNQENVIPY